MRKVGHQQLWVASCWASLAAVALASCDRGGHTVRTSDTLGADDTPCRDVRGRGFPDTPTVVVKGEETPCTLEFREVVTLAGSEGGALPKQPVRHAPGGEWLTATYNPGEIAVWSASGELQRVFGKGPGEGPGEFNTVWDLLVDSVASELYIFTGRSYIEVYSLAGAPRRRITLNGGSLMSGVLLADGTLVMPNTPRSPEDPRFLVVRDDSIVLRTGPPMKWPGGFAPVLLAEDDELWSAETPWYEITHYKMPDGYVDLSIRRDVSWFPEPTEEDLHAGAGAMLFSFDVDSERGLLYTMLQQVRDPEAPSRPAPRPKNAEEGNEVYRRYFDGMIEVFTLNGRLLASRRYDYGLRMPGPLTSSNPTHLWGRVEDDPFRSITLLRPELVESKGGT